MSQVSEGPFSDLVVVEIGQFVVGPFCAQFLADGGAKVIKVEALAGDPYRREDTLAPMESRQFTIKNRGKESLPLKLGHPRAAEVLNRLFDIADVVIVNARVETLQRHGISYDDVSKRNPRIIYALAAGFGTVGPDAQYGGMDVVAQARSGVMLALGAEQDGLPYHSEVQVADYATALLLLAGIGAALHRRSVTGRGQEVTVSLLGGALTLQNNVFMHFFDHDSWREEFLQAGPSERSGRGMVARGARRETRIDATGSARHDLLPRLPHERRHHLRGRRKSVRTTEASWSSSVCPAPATGGLTTRSTRADEPSKRSSVPARRPSGSRSCVPSPCRCPR